MGEVEVPMAVPVQVPMIQFPGMETVPMPICERKRTTMFELHPSIPLLWKTTVLSSSFNYSFPRTSTIDFSIIPSSKRNNDEESKKKRRVENNNNNNNNNNKKKQIGQINIHVVSTSTSTSTSASTLPLTVAASLSSSSTVSISSSSTSSAGLISQEPVANVKVETESTCVATEVETQNKKEEKKEKENQTEHEDAPLNYKEPTNAEALMVCAEFISYCRKKIISPRYHYFYPPRIYAPEFIRGYFQVIGCALEIVFKSEKYLKDKLPTLDQIVVFHSICLPQSSIREYFECLFNHMGFTIETAILAFIFINRIHSRYPSYPIDNWTIHRLLLTALVVADKSTNDAPYKLEYWSQIGGLPKKEITKMECEFLNLIDHDTFTNLPQYVDVFNELAHPDLHIQCTCPGKVTCQAKNYFNQHPRDIYGQPQQDSDELKELLQMRVARPLPPLHKIDKT